MQRIFQTALVVRNNYVVAYDYDVERVGKSSADAQLQSGTFNLHNRNFSGSAQKRFNDALDNLVNIFESADATDPGLLFYRSNGLTYLRRPVFLTLTVPRQKLQDKDVRKQCLKPLLDNLSKSYGLKLYIWRAEAQLRGDIHYHCVIDAFIRQENIRRLWYGYLKRTGMLAPGQELSSSSRICWMNQVHEIASLKFELSGYFAAKREDDGALLYKHDRSKTVRDIDGNSWGRSDLLNYPLLTIDQPDEAICGSISRNCIMQKPVFAKIADREVNIATVYVTRQSRPQQCVQGEVPKYVTEIRMPAKMRETLYNYHFNIAKQIYGAH
jgi:hypothetical protein